MSLTPGCQWGYHPGVNALPPGWRSMVHPGGEKIKTAVFYYFLTCCVVICVVALLRYIRVIRNRTTSFRYAA